MWQVYARILTAGQQLINMGPESGIHLKSVHILTPGHVNGTDTWKMDQVGGLVRT